MRDWAPYDPRRSCVDSALVPVHQTCGQQSTMLHSSHPSLHEHFSRRLYYKTNRCVNATPILSFPRYAVLRTCHRLGSILLLTIREASFTFGASLSPTIAISCFYTCSTQAFHPGIICLSCPSTKGRLMYFIFLSCLHQSLPIGVRIQGLSLQAPGLSSRLVLSPAVSSHICIESRQSSLYRVPTRAGLLRRDTASSSCHDCRYPCSSVNLQPPHYQVLSLPDMLPWRRRRRHPSRRKCLDADEQFLDYSHILTLPPLPTESVTRHLN